MVGSHSCAAGCARQPLLPSWRENIDWEVRQLASPIIEKRSIRVLPTVAAGIRWGGATSAAIPPATVDFVAGVLLDNIDFVFVSHGLVPLRSFIISARDKALAECDDIARSDEL